MGGCISWHCLFFIRTLCIYFYQIIYCLLIVFLMVNQWVNLFVGYINIIYFKIRLADYDFSY